MITAAGKSLGRDVDPATSDGRLLGRTILRGYATLLTELQETIATIPRQVGAALTKPAVPNFPFLQFWSDFERHKVDMREWKGYTTSNAASTARLFKGFFPAASVAEVYKAA